MRFSQFSPDRFPRMQFHWRNRPRHRLRLIPHGVHICGNPYRRSESSQFHTFSPTNKSVKYLEGRRGYGFVSVALRGFPGY
jgi:hypothetical protein